MDQNRGNSEINPCIFGQLIHDEGAKSTVGERTDSSINHVEKTGSHMQENGTGPQSFSLYTKVT